MATKPKSDPSKPKPRNLGHAADMLYEIQRDLKSANQVVDVMKSRESWLKEYFINNLSKSEATGVSGQYINVRVENKDVPQITDWDAFHAWVSRTKSWDTIQKRLNESAILARVEEGRKVAGMSVIQVPVVRIRKA